MRETSSITVKFLSLKDICSLNELTDIITVLLYMYIYGHFLLRL